MDLVPANQRLVILRSIKHLSHVSAPSCFSSFRRRIVGGSPKTRTTTNIYHWHHPDNEGKTSGNKPKTDWKVRTNSSHSEARKLRWNLISNWNHVTRNDFSCSHNVYEDLVQKGLWSHFSVKNSIKKLMRYKHQQNLFRASYHDETQDEKRCAWVKDRPIIPNDMTRVSKDTVWLHSTSFQANEIS